MIESLESLLATSLLRYLERNPHLDQRVAIKTLLDSAAESGLADLSREGIRDRLASLGNSLRRYGVLNPNWLKKLRPAHLPHFFLVDAQPGWLEHLVRQSEEEGRRGISQYILYGAWDSLIILYGTKKEAEALWTQIDRSIYVDATYFTAASTLMLYGHRISSDAQASARPLSLELDRINEVVQDYNAPSRLDLREQLTESGVLIGSTWLAHDGRPYGIVAFVGITLHGKGTVLPDDVYEYLRSHEVVGSSLVHLFEIDRGQPYHYFAKLACTTMTELDAATDAIGSIRIKGLRLEGTTLVVANGIDEIPLYRKERIRTLLDTPNIVELEDLSQGMITAFLKETRRLPGHQAGSEEEVIGKFNRLSPFMKLVALKTFDELHRRLETEGVLPESKTEFRAAVVALEREILERGEAADLRGAVMNCALIVEARLHGILRSIVRIFYANDATATQNELRLPSSKINKLSMGKMLVGLRRAGELEKFGSISSLSEGEWLDRAESFVGERNRWAHGALPATWDGARRIDEARRFAVEAIDIVEWLEGSLRRDLEQRTGETAEALDIRRRRHDRLPGIFIACAKEDAERVRDLAVSLKALNYRVWYEGWSLRATDPILRRLKTHLVPGDILVVMVSSNSIKSKWLGELSSRILAELEANDVGVIPVKLDHAPAPEALLRSRIVEMSEEPDEGMIELIRSVRRQRLRVLRKD